MQVNLGDPAFSDGGVYDTIIAVAPRTGQSSSTVYVAFNDQTVGAYTGGLSVFKWGPLQWN